MKKGLSKHYRSNSLVDCAPRSLLPLFAVGGSLVAGPATAIELGEAAVQSQLGQPLRASIAFALAPKEQIFESCISLGPGQSGLPGIGRASISIADGALLLRGSTPIREPMIAANVVISCPSSAHLAREYMMFIDPAGTRAAEPAASAQPTAAAQPAAVTAPVSAAPVRRSAATASPPAVAREIREPIGVATRYRVQPGDSLSEITQRIENRPPGLWAAVNTIFEANPEAFIDNDPNKLKAGSWLTIPSFDGSEPVVGTTVKATVKPVVKEVVPATDVAEIAPVTNAAEVITTPSPAVVAQPVEPEAAQPPVPVIDPTTDLEPGELSLDRDNVASTVPVAASENIDIPDTALVAPETSSTSPNVTTAVVQQRAEQVTSSWMLWLAGSGVAIILALLLFGRSLRGRFGLGPDALNSELPMRDAPPKTAHWFNDDVDYNLDDDSPTAENPALDADLVMGTGLNQTAEVDTAKDVGFPSPTEVDIELPFEAELAAEAANDEIRSATLSADSTILESEILPESDDYPDSDDFDMSVVLDATKMPRPEDVSHSNLETIEMNAPTDTMAALDEDDEVTAESTIDLTILEQDYENEMTATQALSMDITQAALMLANETGVEKGPEEIDGASFDDDATAAMALAEVADHDAENQPEADTGEVIILDEDTQDVSFDDEFTMQLSDDEKTVDMPTVDEDKTREMPARPAKADKKAG